MATFYEKPTQKLGVGDDVTHYDNGKDEYPKKWVNGKVTEVGEDDFLVQWEDFEDPTEYEWAKTTIKGCHIFERESRIK